MKHFTFKQCALALCLGLASFLPGQSIATNAPNVSSPIGMELGEEEKDTFNPSAEDLSVLERLADAGNELATFYEKEEWKENRTYQAEDGPNIGVTWNSSNPARITSLFIKNQLNLTSLNLNGLDSLHTLTLSKNINLSGKLDLSAAHSLQQVSIDNSQYLYDDISFPMGYDSTNIVGTSLIRYIGTTRDEQSVKVPNGASIDLSPYVTEGTTLSWTQNGGSISLEPTESYKYTLNGTIGDYFICTLQHTDFPNWKVQTLKIYLDAGGVYYDEQDYNGLVKLATDNPQTPYLQELLQNGVWKETGNSIVKLAWNIDGDNNARLTELEINPEGNETEGTAAHKLDLTAFTSLWNLKLSNLKYVDSVDVSTCSALWRVDMREMVKVSSLKLPKNSELRDLILFGIDELALLDLSHCKNLEQLNLQFASKLTTLDLSNCENLRTMMMFIVNVPSLDFSALTNLSFLQLNANSTLQALDLSSSTNLEALNLMQCPALKSITGLDKLTSLKYLSVENMDSTLNAAVQDVNYSSLQSLSLKKSDLKLPEVSKITKLTSLGLPKSITSFDLSPFENLKSLNVEGTAIHYSELSNYREEVSIVGPSTIELPGSFSDPRESLPCISIGAIIDFSSEVDFAGKTTHFVWYDQDDGTEEKDLFVEDANNPGVFTINPNVPINQSGKYQCKIWNEAVSTGVSSWWSYGWAMQTEPFKIVTETPYNADDLGVLEKIVAQSNSDELKDWWSQGHWTNSNVTYYFDKGTVTVTWNDDKRLTKLKLTSFGNLLTGTLNLSAATELEELSFYLTEVEGCIFPENPKLQELDLLGSKVALPTNVKFPTLFYLYLSDVQDSLDLAQLPALSRMEVYGKPTLKYSAIQNPREVFIYGNSLWQEPTWAETNPVNQYNYHGITNFIKAAEAKTVNFSSETAAGAKVTWEKQIKDLDYETIKLKPDETGAYNYSAALAEHKSIRAKLTHPYYAQWYIYFNAMLYTEPGDANIDGKVNVLDIAATLPYVLKDYNNQLPIFGYYQADLDHNEKIEVADVVAIVNRIKDNATPSTESAASSFKSAFVPKVYVTSEADGKLYVDTQVPLAGLQLTFTGVEQEIPLLGEAAHFAHAAHASDSLRMVAYSMDASTITAGRTLLAQLPKGATLVEALFADANAQSLKADLSGIVTATEEIWDEMPTEQVVNYPNPFHGQTTFTYGVEGQADQAVIRIYATNGALVRVLNDLPVALGKNQYRATIDLPAGLYLYRLEISRAGRVISTQTNNLIIK